MAEHKTEGSVLVDKLGQAYQGIKKGPSRGMLVVIGLVVLAVVVGLSWRYFRRSSRESVSGRWRKLNDAVFRSQVDSLAKDKEMKETAPGRVARFREARLLMAAGQSALGQKLPQPTDDRTPQDYIKQAVEIYEGLVKEGLPSPLLKQEAQLAIAEGREALGNLEGAKQSLEQLRKEFPKSVNAKFAEKELERLSPPEGSQAKRELDAVTREYAGAVTE